MDADTFSKLVTALTEYKSDSSFLNQTAFQPDAVNNMDFVNKALAPFSKPEHMNVADGNSIAFMANASAMNAFQASYLHPAPDNEQVPMDDDPLESFTFWDGENFYCNQDLDANCGLSPNLPDENDMAELQDYLIHDVVVAEDLAQLNSASSRNPTLAELNSCNDTLFDCSADNSFLSEDSGYLLSPEFLSKSVPINECSNLMNPAALLMSNSGLYVGSTNMPAMNIPEPKSSSQSLLSSSCPATSRTMSCPQYYNPCGERLLLCPQNSPSSDSFVPKRDGSGAEKKQLLLPGPSKSTLMSNKRFRPSSSLPVSSPLDVVRATSSPGLKAESPCSSYGSKCTEKSLSGFAELSLSNDDESGSYFDSDHDDDGDDDGFSSEEDSCQYENDEIFSTSWPPGKDSKSQSRRNRYFWQYNLQSRGVKTQNLIPLSEEGDPYVLNDVKDPVFSEDCTLPVKHSGKARKGDGNDLTPNPRKLFSIGLELKKLNRLISNLNPSPEYTVNGKPLSRKEKNKLASRVCRLKKKAQHEANKIKLYGLQQEHKRLLTILIDLKRLMVFKIENYQETQNMPLSQKVEDYLTVQEPFKVAGNTTEFVNEVLDKVSSGDHNGGLGKI